MEKTPILNNPYEEPKYHYSTNTNGELDYEKIEIDDEAFERLYGFKSHPFDYKSGQKIAVRVISQFGEESTKVM